MGITIRLGLLDQIPIENYRRRRKWRIHNSSRVRLDTETGPDTRQSSHRQLDRSSYAKTACNLKNISDRRTSRHGKILSRVSTTENFNFAVKAGKRWFTANIAQMMNHFQTLPLVTSLESREWPRIRARQAELSTWSSLTHVGAPRETLSSSAKKATWNSTGKKNASSTPSISPFI